MKLSVVIPAYNEAGSIEKTLRTLYAALQEAAIDHEIVVVNDNSQDQTLSCLAAIAPEIPTLAYYTNPGPNSFGYAVRYGLARYQGDCVALMMADLSDDPADLVRYYRKLQEGYACVFGSRWVAGGRAVNYPQVKKLVNRLVNNLVRLVFRLPYDDCTNAFKLYRRETVDGLQPLLSTHFSLTLELPLKAIVRGYSYATLPNSWYNRQHGVSKLRLRDNAASYLRVLIYCLMEKQLSRPAARKSSS